MRAEMVAAGESHVLVVCTLRSRSNNATADRSHHSSGAGPHPTGPPAAAGGSAHDGGGSASADTSGFRLVAWGVNQQGQLGCACPDDCNVPQFVVGINGRRVLHLAAGGTFSMAVCEHDPREAAARWST